MTVYDFENALQVPPLQLLFSLEDYKPRFFTLLMFFLPAFECSAMHGYLPNTDLLEGIIKEVPLCCHTRKRFPSRYEKYSIELLKDNIEEQELDYGRSASDDSDIIDALDLHEVVLNEEVEATLDFVSRSVRISWYNSTNNYGCLCEPASQQKV